jgi:hypothetical protein
MEGLMPLILILLGFLLALYAVFPSSWFVGIAALVLLLVGAFGMVMSK